MRVIAVFLVLFGTTIFLMLPEDNGLEPQEFADALKSKGEKTLIDLRSSDDFSKGHISGAVNIDYDSPTFNWRIAELDSMLPVFMYCQNGERSKKALSYLESKGFQSVTLLNGGLTQWISNKQILTPEELIPPTELKFEDFCRMLELEHFVIVEFYLPGNNDCRKVESALDELALTYEGKIKILRVDIDTYKYLATEMGIETVPTLQFYENGNLSGTIEGVSGKERIDADFQLKENNAATTINRKNRHIHS